MLTQYRINQSARPRSGSVVGHTKSRPGFLPKLPQIFQGVIAASEAGAWVHTLVHRKTGQTYALTTTVSGAVEADTLDELVAAWRADVKFNQLFSIVEDGSDTWTATARYAGVEYALTSDPPGSMTDTITQTQAPGGTGLSAVTTSFVVRNGLTLSGTPQIAAPSASSTLADLYGCLKYNDARHLHSLENDDPDAVDRYDRDSMYGCMYEGFRYFDCATSVAPGDAVWLHIDGANAGKLGNVPAGGQQVYTITPTASDGALFGIQFDYGGRTYHASMESGTSASATLICNGLRTALGTIPGLAFGGTATLTITTAAGTAISNIKATGDGVFASITESTPANVDAIDISSIASFETTGSTTSNALVRVKM